MKKIYKLNQKLEYLESRKQNFSSLENISIIRFIKYKNLISKENKISKQMQKITSLGEEINFWYDSNTKSWIENPKINCRKYYRLEQNAAYKKDLKLYKLGLIDKKPLPPLIQNLYNKFNPILKSANSTIKENHPKIQKYNFFKIFYDKYKNFTSYTLPQKLNKLAINSTKKCIKCYRKIHDDISFFRRCITYKNSIKYLHMIKQEATKQLDACENVKSFRDSIRVENIDSSNYISLHENKADMNKEIFELSL